LRNKLFLIEKSWFATRRDVSNKTSQQSNDHETKSKNAIPRLKVHLSLRKIDWKLTCAEVVFKSAPQLDPFCWLKSIRLLIHGTYLQVVNGPKFNSNKATPLFAPICSNNPQSWAKFKYSLKTFSGTIPAVFTTKKTYSHADSRKTLPSSNHERQASISIDSTLGADTSSLVQT